MNSIDLHCDTAIRLLYEDLELRESICKVDITKLRKSGALAQVFAHFVELNIVENPYEEFKKINKKLMKEIEKNSDDIEVVTNLEEMYKAKANNKIGAFLSIEEGEVLEGRIERLKEVYDLGIRFITLTWNFENSIGYPNINFKYKDRGLKEKGKELVVEMEKLGIIPDCSHLSDAGFYGLVNICKKPFVATHSNARAITNHPRNLTDDMIRLLASKGGVIGLNFYGEFLGSGNFSKIENMLAHIKHIVNIGGIEVLCIGSDFDGIDSILEIENIGQTNKLIDALKHNNFSEDYIEKLFYKNALRFLKEIG